MKRLAFMLLSAVFVLSSASCKGDDKDNKSQEPEKKEQKEQEPKEQEPKEKVELFKKCEVTNTNKKPCVDGADCVELIYLNASYCLAQCTKSSDCAALGDGYTCASKTNGGIAKTLNHCVFTLPDFSICLAGDVSACGGDAVCTDLKFSVDAQAVFSDAPAGERVYIEGACLPPCNPQDPNSCGKVALSEKDDYMGINGKQTTCLDYSKWGFGNRCAVKVPDGMSCDETLLSCEDITDTSTDRRGKPGCSFGPGYSNLVFAAPNMGYDSNTGLFTGFDKMFSRANGTCQTWCNDVSLCDCALNPNAPTCQVLAASSDANNYFRSCYLLKPDDGKDDWRVGHCAVRKKCNTNTDCGKTDAGKDITCIDPATYTYKIEDRDFRLIDTQKFCMILD